MICFRRKHKRMEKLMGDIADDMKTALGLLSTINGQLTSVIQGLSSANETVAAQPTNNDVATITSGLGTVNSELQTLGTQIANGFTIVNNTLSGIAASLVPTPAATATTTQATPVAPVANDTAIADTPAVPPAAQ